MMGRLIVATVLLLYISTGCAHADTGTDALRAIEIPEDFQLTMQLEEKRIHEPAAYTAYLQAYVQGILDAKFPESQVCVTVRNGDILLSSLPVDATKASQIVSYVQNFVTVRSVSQVQTTYVKKDEGVKKEELIKRDTSGDVWLPQSTILYPTQLADPLRVCFSGGVRFGDDVAGHTSTPVTFGDQFPIYRWTDISIGNKVGALQVDIEGTIFAIFNQSRASSPLINADYYVAVPLTYAYDRWAHRMRVYHISSHLGDEYMKHHHHVKRLNKSFEAIDYFASYNLTPHIRLYGGVGVIAHSDSEMRLKPLYAQYGMEVRVGRHEWKQVYGMPFLAMQFANYQDSQWDFNSNFAIGYEIGKLNNLGKKVRLSLEYHNGYCNDGQFSRMRSDYVQARISYGF